MEQIIKQISDFVWGLPLLILLVGTGIWLTIILRGIQFTKLGFALHLGLIKRKEEGDQPGDITHFQALMTALSATVGTGNIAGVATAIATGGPGALFWMWITGLFGMATKYAEAVLAVKYREKDELGTMSGGPMYYISKGLGWKWLGILFAFFAAVAAFGIGNMVQSNSVADVLSSNFGIPHGATGLILMVATAIVIIGGIKSIGRVTGVLVPIMILFYIGGGLIILIMNIRLIPETFMLIINHAFSPTAASGGFLGATIQQTIRMGVARGVFSNESGLGSAPIAAAAAQSKHPVSQALVSMTQTFIDTIVVCTMTGLILLVTGTWNNGENGAALTSSAFQTGLPGEWGHWIVAIGLVLFAYSTILGWSYYGEKSIEYLAGVKAVKPYRYIFVLFVGIGAIAKLNLVWSLADIFNGLMAFPNLIGLLGLSSVLVATTKEYFNK
ncbi:MAG: sodium:alanine symporter family protein [Calditrichia bacterium]